ncbi:hypothetical protein C5167_044070 [Papaver somniferum]|uniref:Uncharacterized protein n=1 Tax=Papaver somniferum TaxID=3469 RepID=A0A4Y7LB28_PAPSO|nr:hypothetical protein C5167_044070 [Papaver somniferum]
MSPNYPQFDKAVPTDMNLKDPVLDWLHLSILYLLSWDISSTDTRVQDSVDAHAVEDDGEFKESSLTLRV